jgi:hypothetical protein
MIGSYVALSKLNARSVDRTPPSLIFGTRVSLLVGSQGRLDVLFTATTHALDMHYPRLTAALTSFTLIRSNKNVFEYQEAA